jgi:hypothetical protein
MRTTASPSPPVGQAGQERRSGHSRPHARHTHHACLSERSMRLSLANCEKPYDNKTSRSISPMRKPPPLLRPAVG